MEIKNRQSTKIERNLGDVTQSQVLGNYFNMGFTIQEDDDHMVQLNFKDEKIAVFSAMTTAEALRAACRDYINDLDRQLATAFVRN